jgi:hypothetical protein
MPERHYKVEVQEDHIERLANARPIQAIAELIWNGVDADANRIIVPPDRVPLPVNLALAYGIVSMLGGAYE